MPVEKDINLDKPLTDEEIRSMEEEADRLEQLAVDAQDDAKKAKQFQKEEDKFLNDAIKKIEKLEKEAEKAEKAKNRIGKSIKEVNELASHKSALGQMGGEGEFQEGGDPYGGLGGREAFSGRISKGRTGFGTGTEKSPTGQIDMMQAQRLEFQKKTKEALSKATKERMENAKHLASQKKVMSNIQKGQQEFFALSRNPVGFMGGQLKGMIGKAGIYGFIALAVIGMAEQIYQEVKKMYGPGGPYDVRKQMLQRDQEITELNHIQDRRTGRVFFTSDVELQQGAPDFSQTTRLRDRVSLYQNWHLGE